MLIGTSTGGAHSKVMEDVWKKTLATIPSDFGKLVYLASLCDVNSGTYHHYGLENVYSPEQCDLALRSSHMNVFYHWLEKPLEEQKDDLEFYLRGVEGDTSAVMQNWKILQPYLAYAPVECQAAAREWFLSDLRIILDLLLAETATRGPESTA